MRAAAKMREVDIVAEFRDAMSRRGIIPPMHIITDGKIHRCDTAARNGKGDASYLLHLDDLVPAGGFPARRDRLGRLESGCRARTVSGGARRPKSKSRSLAAATSRRVGATADRGRTAWRGNLEKELPVYQSSLSEQEGTRRKLRRSVAQRPCRCANA